MSTVPTNANITYFGKVPSRGDFVKSGSSLPLLNSLDNWLARTMDSMSTDARWKSIYDEVEPFLKAIGRFPNVIRMRNTRTREYVSIAGREVAGTDPSGVVDTTRIWREDPVRTLL